MGCEVLTDPKTGQNVGFICGRGRPPAKRCQWCGRPAPYLCDGPASPPKRTCDAPLCETHRTNTGPERDLCPDHAPKPRR